MKKLLAILLIIPSFAFAEEAPKEYALKLTEHEVVVIANALAGQPYAQVAPLMQKLQTQISGQEEPQVPTPPKKR